MCSASRLQGRVYMTALKTTGGELDACMVLTVRAVHLAVAATAQASASGVQRLRVRGPRQGRVMDLGQAGAWGRCRAEAAAAARLHVGMALVRRQGQGRCAGSRTAGCAAPARLGGAATGVAAGCDLLHGAAGDGRGATHAPFVRWQAHVHPPATDQHEQIRRSAKVD